MRPLCRAPRSAEMGILPGKGRLPRHRACLLLFACLTLAPGPTPCAQPPPFRTGTKGGGGHTDRPGEPLPAGASARLGTYRLRHQDWVTIAVFSPDGRFLASGGERRTLFRLWDAATGEEIRRVPAADYDSHSVLAFSPNGKLLAAAADREGGEDISLREAVSGRELRKLRGHERTILAAVFVNGGKALVSVGRAGVVRRWDVASGRLLRAWDPMATSRGPAAGASAFKGFYQAALSQDGHRLAVMAGWGEGKGGRPAATFTLVVWDVAARKELWRAGKGELNPGVFGLSADGKVLAARRGESDLTIRDAATGKERKRLKDPDPRFTNLPDTLAVSADGRLVAALGQGQAGVRVWDTVTGKPVWQLGRSIIHGVRSGAYPLAFSADARRLLFPIEDTLVVWDLARGREHPLLEGHRRPVTWLLFSPDGRRLISGTGTSAYYPEDPLAWQLSTRRATPLLERKNGWRVVPASPDYSRYLKLTEKDGSLHVHDMRTGKVLCRLALRYPHEIPGYGQFSPNNRLLALPGTREDGKLLREKFLLLDAVTGKRLGVIPAPGFLRPLAFSPDNQKIAWHNRDGTIDVAEVTTGKRIWRLGTPRKHWLSGRRPTLVFSPDGRRLAAWDRACPDVIVWDVATGKPYCRLPGKEPEFIDCWSVSLAFSLDGRALAVGAMGGENDIQYWELTTGKLRRQLSGHRSAVLSLAFSPDGRLLASGSADTTILLWELARGGP